jgi:serine/threonine protein kinase
MPVTERLPASLGPYRLQERLGEGGMGVVHLALDPEGRLVAIKVLRSLMAQDVNARRRMIREVETMRRVRSPFVAEVVDADVTGEFPYIVTRYVRGTTLDDMVRRQGPLSAAGVQLLAHGLAEALAAIHAAGIVHRDLKPGNVILTDDRPVVIDFGIAQPAEATRLTQAGMVMGTPGYLAPEVIEGQPSSPASDIHSWGATVAYAATGRPPYGAGSFETIFFRVVSGRPDLTGVPGALVPLVSAALAKDPLRRPAAAWLGAHAANPGTAPAASSFIPALPGTVPAAPSAYSSRDAFGRPAPQPPTRDAFDRAAPLAPAPVATAPLGPAPKGPPLLPAGPIGRAGIPTDVSARSSARQDRQDGQDRLDRQAHPKWLPGLAFSVIAAALTVVLPVAGLLGAVAAITLLRAADLAQHRLSVRRTLRGPRPSDPLLVILLAPLSVLRALLTTLLLAPLALAAGTAAWAATIVLTHHAASPRAPAFAAAAVVACYGLGPGSKRPRRQLRQLLSPLARTPMSATAATVATWSLAAAAITFAISQPPFYWPAVLPALPHGVAFPHVALIPQLPHLPHLPSIHSLVSSAANWLAKHART